MSKKIDLILFALFLIAIVFLTSVIISFNTLVFAGEASAGGEGDSGPGSGTGDTGDDAGAVGPQSDGSTGSTGGTGGGDVIGDGVCGPTETCATDSACGACCDAKTGQTCDSCGNTYQCDGTCPLTDTSKVGLSCGSCGGTIQADCSCSKPNPLKYGEPCDSCGGKIGCDGKCTIPNPPRYGQSCESCGGTINCDNLCSKLNPPNYLQPCTNNQPDGTNPGCGNGECKDYIVHGTLVTKGACATDDSDNLFCDPDTITPTADTYTENCRACPQDCGQCPDSCNAFDCSGNCNFNGFCTPPLSQCASGRHQTCDSTAKCLAYDGTDLDKDGIDKECGDSKCDNAPVVTDAAKTETETSCGDGLDNDCNGLTDCADTNCQNNPPCCTVTKRDCREYTQIQYEAINEINWEEEQQKEQVNDPNEEIEKKEKRKKLFASVVNNQFYACPPDDTDTACCPDSSCVYNGKCYSDGAPEDVGKDGKVETCVAHSPGQWVAGVEFDCTDNFDNDGDQLTDCEDPDCDGSVTGNVRDEDSQAIVDAGVVAKKDITNVKETISDQTGFYSLTPINCGIYSIVASHSNYAPQIKTVNVPPNDIVVQDFSLLLGSSCEGDCTFVEDNIVHAACNNKNGCEFFDEIAKAACDNSQPSWVRDYYNPPQYENHYIECAEGLPQPKVEIQASVSCDRGTLVKMTRIVVYKGKPVKLIVAVCG